MRSMWLPACLALLAFTRSAVCQQALMDDLAQDPQQGAPLQPPEADVADVAETQAPIEGVVGSPR